MNIGNTNVQYAESDGKIIGRVCQVPTAEFTDKIIPDDCVVAAVSVVPALKKSLEHRDIYWLTSKSRLNIDLSRVDAPALGGDRLANAVNLAAVSRLPACSIDFGTCITFEVIDENNVFRGGAIAPGRTLLRRSLHNYTAQLPMIPLCDEAAPDLGETTESAMRLGVDNGVVGTVQELIADVRRHFVNKEVIFYATGGDQKFFTDRIGGLISGGDEFTLQGVLKGWEMNCR